ncbi:prophage endopeptidase tail family protein [Staphylococcus xylosus]
MQYKHDYLAIMNLEETICENIVDIDYGSFKDTYSLNDSRKIEFRVLRSSENQFIYNLLICENFIIYQGERFVIKEVNPKVEGNMIYSEITAHHIIHEFQNHFVESNKKDDDEVSEDKPIPQYTLEEYLNYGFKNQETRLRYSYKIYGNFNEKVELEELGGKNGREYINESVELFGCIIYANDTEIGFYDEESFYHMTEEIIRHPYNTDTMDLKVSTLELRTVIKAYGQKYKSEETKNYQSIKPPQLSYTNDFQKEKTWGTDKIGGKATVTIDCKHGDETIIYTIKKGKDGGLFDAYIDGNKIGRYSCWAKHAGSEKIDLKKNVSKGKHTLEFVFVGKDPKYKLAEGVKPRYLVGTEKSEVINTTANTSGEKAYKAVVTHTSDNAKLYGKRFAGVVTNDKITNNTELRKWAKSQLQDTPKTDLEVNYISQNKLTPRDKVFFVNEIMGYNTELKVVKLERSHPYTNKIDTVSFSNEIKDMIQIQQSMNQRLRAQDNQFNYQANEMNKLYTHRIGSPFEYQTIGSVIE